MTKQVVQGEGWEESMTYEIAVAWCEAWERARP